VLAVGAPVCADIQDARDTIQDEKVETSARESFGDTLAKARADALKPISGEDRAKWGLPPNITTYADIADSGLRVLSESDKKALNDAIGVKLSVRRLRSYLSIFPKDTTPQARIAAKKQLIWEASTRPKNLPPDRLDPITGEPLWRVYLRYQRTRENTAIMFRRLAGENSSRFSDKDMEVALKQMPKSGLMYGNLLDDRATAESGLKEVEEYLDELMMPILKGPVQPVTGVGEKGLTGPPPTTADAPPRQSGETPEEYLDRIRGG